MHRSPAELKEFLAHAIALSGNVMPLTLVARDQEELDWLAAQIKKAKKQTQCIGVRLDPGVLSVKGIGKGKA